MWGRPRYQSSGERNGKESEAARQAWTKSNAAELRKYSKDKFPVKKISRLMSSALQTLE
jgi:hypothetical protein